MDLDAKRSEVGAGGIVLGRNRSGHGEKKAVRRHPLSTREQEVARLIASGMTNGQIAAALGIAPRTASSHVEHILAKLGATRRTEIASRVASLPISHVGYRS